MSKLLWDVIQDTVIDGLKLLPFLFVTYLVMEYLESRTEKKTQQIVRKAGWLGPAWGGLLGIVPQCGFSAAAANLYAGRAISLGTLLAVFLSTSDEMLPIMISEAVPVPVIVRLLLTKAGIAVLAGFMVDAVCHILPGKPTGQADDESGLMIERLCEKEHCHCEEGGIVKSALRHTIHIFLFILLITFLLNLIFAVVGEDTLGLLISDMSVAGIFGAALVGLIPNCAVSVALTQLYLHGILSSGQLLAGLLVGAGVGLLVLYRVNPELKENLKITGLLYLIGVAGGLMVNGLGLNFL